MIMDQWMILHFDIYCLKNPLNPNHDGTLTPNA